MGRGGARPPLLPPQSEAVTQGEAPKWWTGWRASPCPTPGPLPLPLPAVLVPPGTVARPPGDGRVSGACRFSNTAAKAPTLTPSAADTRTQGIGSGQGWLTATSSISNSFKEATIHFPTLRSFSQLRGCSPSHLSPWLVSQMPRPTARETFVRVTQCFPPNPHRCPVPNRVKSTSSQGPMLPSVTWPSSPLEGCSHH